MVGFGFFVCLFFWFGVLLGRFGGVVWKVEERGEFQTSGQDAKAAEVTPVLWVSPK